MRGRRRDVVMRARVVEVLRRDGVVIGRSIDNDADGAIEMIRWFEDNILMALHGQKAAHHRIYINTP